MKRPLRATIGGLVLLALLALVVVAGMWVLGGRARSVTLRNGVTLNCLGLSYGTNHVVYSGSPLGNVVRRLLQAVLPRLGSRGSGLVRHTTGEPSLTVWLQEVGANATNRVTTLSLQTLIADERGVMAGSREWLTLGFGNAGVLWQDFGLLPRRTRTLSLCFFEQGPAGVSLPLGTLELPNPVFTHAPPLIAEPLPRARTNGSLTCILENLVFGTGYSSKHSTLADGTEVVSASPAKPGEAVSASALLAFREGDTNTTHWTIGTLTTSDGSGNSAKASSFGSQAVGDRVLFRFSPVPWPDEPWRIEAWAKRTTAAWFGPDELVIQTDIALPAVGQTNVLGRAAQASGVELTVKGFVRQARVQGGSYSSEELSRLVIEIPSLPEGMFVDLVRVQDDQGRVLTSDMTSTSHGTPMKIEYGFREVPEDSHALEVTLAIHQGRAFTFVAQPQRAEAGGFRFELR